RRSKAPRPPPAPQRLRHPAADDPGSRRRKPRHGSSATNQHRQTPRPLPVPTRLPALPPHSQHAGGAPTSAHRAIRRTPPPKRDIHRRLRDHINEGILEVRGGKAKGFEILARLTARRSSALGGQITLT